MVSVSRVLVSVVVLAVMLAVAHAPVAGAPARNVSAEGAVYTFGSGPSGEMVMTADSGDLHVEKSVAPDGSSVLILRAGAEQVRLEVKPSRVAVSDPHGDVSFVPDSGDEKGETAVRVALARSRAVQVFRSLAAQVRARGTKGAFEQAVLLSGAVVAQLGGEPRALRDFGRGHRPAGGIQRAAFGRITDCWGEYERYILAAYDQYLYCLTDTGRLLRYSLSWCDIQYTIRAESAWFQFLACSTIPIV